jgi:hypothetical protein
MESFLWWIGLYNAVGAALLPLFALSPRLASKLLVEWTEIVTPPYDHGAHGGLWLWWAGAANGFLGVIMMLATRWGESAQREVVMGAIGVYGVMWLLAVSALWSPRYRRRGLYAVVFVMWPPQIGWGVAALLS